MVDNKNSNIVFNNSYQTLGLTLSIISIVDSIYQMVEIHNNILESSDILFENTYPYRVYGFTILGIRAISAIFYVLICVILSHLIKHSNKRIISITSIYFLLLLSILIVCCKLIRFNTYVLSLIVHILSLYAIFMTFMDHVFRYHGIVSDAIIKNKLVTESPKMMVKILFHIKQNLMAFCTLLSVTLAILIGILLRQMNLEWSGREIMYLNFLGEIFLRILKCLILPLIFSSLVFAIGNMDTKLSGKVAVRVLCYYLSTTFIAVITGIILVSIIQPGIRNKVEHESNEMVHHHNITTIDTVLDLFRNICPDNIVQATFQYYSTVLTCKNQTDPICSGSTKNMKKWQVESTMLMSTNILGVVMFAIVFGFMIGRIHERDLMVCFFKGFNEVIMEMMAKMIQLTPVAVTFLILPQVLKVKDLQVLFGATGYYSLTVLFGIAFHATFTLPAIYWIFTRKNPFVLFKQLFPALITAFGTSSSSATMPVTFKCLEKQTKLDPRIVRFCIPVGATMNMDGTALYEAVAAIFISQYQEVKLEFVQIIIVSITATAASIGAASIPQAGLITMVIVINAIGLNAEDISLIIMVDWFLDRFRTVINVIGDSLGTALVDHLSKESQNEDETQLREQI